MGAHLVFCESEQGRVEDGRGVGEGEVGGEGECGGGDEEEGDGAAEAGARLVVDEDC